MMNLISGLRGEEMQGKAKGAVCMFLCALCWSFSGLFVKIIPWNAYAVICVRCLFAAVTTFLLSKDKKITLDWLNLKTAFCVLMTAVTYIIAIKLTTAANAIVLQYTAPILILIYQILFQRKRPTRLDLVAVCVILIGIVIFFVEGLGAGNLVGNLIALSSAVFFSGVFLCNGSPKARPQQANLLSQIFGTILFLPALITEATPDLAAWGSAVVLGVVTLGIAYFFFAKGSALISPLAGSLITCVEPIFSPLWVGLAIGEIPSPLAFVGMAIVIIGVVGYNFLLMKKVTEE